MKNAAADLRGAHTRDSTIIGVSATSMLNVSEWGGNAAQRSNAETTADAPHMRLRFQTCKITTATPSAGSGSSFRS